MIVKITFIKILLSSCINYVFICPISHLHLLLSVGNIKYIDVLFACYWTNTALLIFIHIILSQLSGSAFKFERGQTTSSHLLDLFLFVFDSFSQRLYLGK
jgi:hypothetical protein